MCVRSFAWIAFGLTLSSGADSTRAGPQGDAQRDRVAALVRQLGHKEYAKREAASKELATFGEPALAALKKAAASDADPEIRDRAGRTIQTITHQLIGTDQKHLEGTWVGVAHEQDGKESPERTKIVLAEGQSVATNPAGVVIFRCAWTVIDPTAAPRKLDLVGSDGRVFQAIYELDGTKLRYCGSYTERPDRFSTRPGDGRYMATLKREPK
ncbi:MAG TPA: TIGR03067 domain-containing protein [Gemmataceae bacterium]|nr:TIGR03067 domain-containing protein [Gemmataceae bacterium]